MSWALFLDDERMPNTSTSKEVLQSRSNVYIARSTKEALELVECLGMPSFISFDHDLGGDDTSIVFIHKLINEYWVSGQNIPEYTIHSANPIGSKNIASLMQSWIKYG